MRTTSFTHNFLLLFSGPLIWALHFVIIYGITGVVCARPAFNPAWLGIGMTMWAIAVAGLVAIVALAAVYLRARPRDTVPDNHIFIRWMSISLSLLAAVAIVWETMTIFLVPVCM